MIKKIYVFILFSNFCFGQYKSSEILDVKLISQKGSNLCWAASTEMITKFLTPTSKFGQKEIVQIYMSVENCCLNQCEKTKSPCKNSCDIEFVPEKNRYDVVFSKLNYTAKQYDKMIISWEILVNEIKNKRPILIAVPQSGNEIFVDKINSTANHVVVICGYIIKNGIKYVKIKDPWLPCTGHEYEIAYDKFKDYKTTFVCNIASKIP